MPPRTATKTLPKRGRPVGRFTQHKRFNRLRDGLEAAPAGLTILEIADMLRITPRSARRYLEEVKKALDLEPVLITPGGANRWRIKAAERGRAVPLRRTQAFALLSTRDLFETIKGSALYEEIDVAMEAIHQIAYRPGRTTHKGDAKGGPATRRTAQRFLMTGASPHMYAARSEDIDELFGATEARHVVRFRYRNDDGTEHEREVAPLAMVLWDGAIHFIAHDPAADDTSIFVLDRMTRVRTTGISFDPPADFQVDDWLHGDFGILPPVRPSRVLIEFDARAADRVRGRKVHPTQKIATAADGRIRLSLVLPEGAQLRRWILGFGGLAHVIEPASLRLEVATELKAALARYGL